MKLIFFQPWETEMLSVEILWLSCSNISTVWGVQWCGAAEVSEPVVCTRSQTHCDEHTDLKVADEPSGRGCGTCTDIYASSNETTVISTCWTSFHCLMKTLTRADGKMLLFVYNIFIFVCWPEVSPLELWLSLQCNDVHDSLWGCTRGFLCSSFQHLTVHHEIPNKQWLL